MPGELTVTHTMPPLSTEYERAPNLVPLNYETPPVPPDQRVTLLTVISSGVRRLCLGAGVAFLVGGVIVMSNPRADEEAAFIGIGLGLITASLPMPKWWG